MRRFSSLCITLFMAVVLSATTVSAAIDQWEMIYPGPVFAAIVLPRSPFAEPEVILAGDETGSVMRSEDGGQTWIPVLPHASKDFAHTIIYPEEVFAATDAGLFRSTDRGATWALFASGTQCAVKVDPFDTRVVYYGNQRTLDGGQSWLQMALPEFICDGRNDTPHLVTAFMLENRVGAMVGNENLLSDDKGETWSQPGYWSKEDAIGLDPVDPERFYLGECNGRFMRFFPGGSDTIDMDGHQHNIVVDPMFNANVYMEARSGFYHSSDFGSTWQVYPSPVLGFIQNGRVTFDDNSGTIYVPSSDGLWRVQVRPEQDPCPDYDGDGYFSAENCGTPVDCNDVDPMVFPGATEYCNDSMDNDCNGLTDSEDPAAVGCVTCTDNDGDGYAQEGGACGAVDCDDTLAAINPGAAESCTDAVDNDCDGLIDADDPDAVGCAPTCTDADGDGYATEGGPCGLIDCDDTVAAVNPGAFEDCMNLIDDDCDGFSDQLDTDCQILGDEVCDDLFDNDGDGNTDCSDRDCRKDPACTDGGGGDPVAEICDDGIDNDGDGKIDCADSNCKKNAVCK